VKPNTKNSLHLIGPFYHYVERRVSDFRPKKTNVGQWRHLIPFSGRSQLRWIGVAFVGHIWYPSTPTSLDCILLHFRKGSIAAHVQGSNAQHRQVKIRNTKEETPNSSEMQDKRGLNETKTKRNEPNPKMTQN